MKRKPPLRRKCPDCGCYDVSRRGYIKTKSGKKPRAYCNKCGGTFYYEES